MIIWAVAYLGVWAILADVTAGNELGNAWWHTAIWILGDAITAGYVFRWSWRRA
jgi:hypothetical protein